jgi:hypothetical protein
MFILILVGKKVYRLLGPDIFKILNINFALALVLC